LSRRDWDEAHQILEPLSAADRRGSSTLPLARTEFASGHPAVAAAVLDDLPPSPSRPRPAGSAPSVAGARRSANAGPGGAADRSGPDHCPSSSLRPLGGRAAALLGLTASQMAADPSSAGRTADGAAAWASDARARPRRGAPAGSERGREASGSPDSRNLRVRAVCGEFSGGAVL